jgi:uncharacterized protein YkwD
VIRCLAALATAAAALAPAASTGDFTTSEQSILREMNRVRVAHELRPLRVDAHLEQAARAHTREMIRTGTFAHGAFQDRLFRFRVQWRSAGENLAWGVGKDGTARSMVAAWLASSEHRANLLRPEYRRVGVGAAVGAFYGFAAAKVVTTDFAG